MMKSVIRHAFVFCIVLYCSFASAARGFLENRGQWHKDVRYRAEMKGGDVLVGTEGLLYRLLPPGPEHVRHSKGSQSAVRLPKVSGVGHAVGLKLIGADKLLFEGEYLQKALFHFYQGDDVSASNVRSYAALNAPEVYPGVDFKLLSGAEGVKYEFHLKAGVAHEVVRLQFEGAEKLLLHNERLHIVTPAGEIIEDKPYAYQIKGNEKLPVRCKFKKLNETTVVFDFPAGYDQSLPLVIDPQLIFSSYSGAKSDNWGFTATYDEEGCLYSGGIVFGSDFPTTPGAIKGNGGDGSKMITDVAIIKYAPDGRSIRYGLYFGGSASDIPVSMMVNSKNELLVQGLTASTDFPGRMNAFAGGSYVGSDPVTAIELGEGTDVFVAKFSPTGSLISSYLLGGSGNDGYLRAMNLHYSDGFRGELYIDGNDNVYVAGCTRSFNFAPQIPLAGASPSSTGSEHDGFVVKMNANLNPSWRFITAGRQDETFSAVRVNAAGEVYAFGHTNSSLSLVSNSPGYLNQKFSGISAFVVRLTGTGVNVLSASYLQSSSGDEYGALMDLDDEENVYLMGLSTGNYPVTSGKYTTGGGVFIHKLSTDLRSSFWSTRVGGTGSSFSYNTLVPTAFMVSRCGQIYFSGWGGPTSRATGTSTFGLPTTANAYRRNTSGSDFYLAVFEKEMTGLAYGSFFGYNSFESADHSDGGTSRFDKKGIVYQSVCSCFDNSAFPTFPADVYSSVNGAQNLELNTCNNAAFKYDLSQLRADFNAVYDFCADNRNVVISNTSTGGTSFSWDFGNGDTSDLRNNNITVSYPENNFYEITLIANDPLTCIKSDTVVKRLPVAQKPIITRPSDTTICPGQPLVLSTDSVKNGVATWQAYNSSWLSPGVGFTTTFTPTESFGRYPITLILADSATGCSAQKRIIVKRSELKADFKAVQTGRCFNDKTVTITGTVAGIDTIIWQFGDGRTSQEWLPKYAYQDFGEYLITYTATGDLCTVKGELPVTVSELDIPNITTPNNDGVNDVFYITGAVEGSILQIFNRWGSELALFTDYQNDWQPAKLPAGVYFYAYTTPEEEVCKGWFQVHK